MVWASEGGVVVSDFFFTKNPIFSSLGVGGIFYKLTRNPNLTFFLEGGGE